MKKLSVGILGATGVIGRQYLSLLKSHPWFEIKCVCATASTSELLEYPFYTIDHLPPCDLLFSALPTKIAYTVEKELAQQGYRVLSSASAHRQNPKVPLIVPEINPHHLELLPNKGGYIVAKPNCSIQSFLLPLAPLHKAFTIRSLSVTTLQAMSGSGKQGVNAAHMEDNILPFIEGEEEKLESEPLKILEPPHFPISSHCTRVPISHGHMACVSVSFVKKPSFEQIQNAWNKPSNLNLPFAPKYPIIYHDDPLRPQPREDKEAGQGMSVTVGRLRECPLFHWRFVALSHNVIRGGAGGGLLSAELLYQKGYLG
ncbi:MAG: Aspartate-semialdehyde dehydrogenase 2 [Chlamydiales bacterium]|nr:Aspartate-semialdehyde dehydrogenase 2 [Chlamydiales bacterium]